MQASLAPYGIAVEALLVRHGVQSDHARPSTDAILAVYAAAAAELGDRSLGLRLGLDRGLAWLGSFGDALRSCATVGDALVFASRFIGLLAEGQRIEQRARGANTEVTIDFSPGMNREGAHVVSCSSLVTMACVLDEMLAPDRWPQTLEFPGPRPDAEIVRRLRRPGRLLLFGARRCALRVPTAILAIAPQWGTTPTARDAVEQLRIARASLGAEQRVEDRLRRWLVLHLAAAPRLSDAARALRMAPRSLQHSLASRGTRFSSVVEEVRLEVAQRLLAQRGATVSDVARHVGFRSLAAFSRFFRQATGLSPRAAKTRRGTAIGDSTARLARRSSVEL